MGSFFGGPTMVEKARIFKKSSHFSIFFTKSSCLSLAHIFPEMPTPYGHPAEQVRPGLLNKPHMRPKSIERAAQDWAGPSFRSPHPIWNFFQSKAIGHMAQNIP
jgi:hypothetical protein